MMEQVHQGPREGELQYAGVPWKTILAENIPDHQERGHVPASEEPHRSRPQGACFVPSRRERRGSLCRGPCQDRTSEGFCRNTISHSTSKCGGDQSPYNLPTVARGTLDIDAALDFAGDQGLRAEPLSRVQGIESLCDSRHSRRGSWSPLVNSQLKEIIDQFFLN
jgi:hypothetical protein